MRLHFVRIPIEDSGPGEAELNRFLATHRILAVDRHLAVDGSRSAWAICITYDETLGGAGLASPGSIATEAPGKKGKVDYREVLPAPQFEVFVRLRALRKQLAERDAIPLYAVFTNEQLAAMVRAEASTLADLGRIDGVGPTRLERYGKRFVDALAQPTAATADAVEEA